MNRNQLNFFTFRFNKRYYCFYRRLLNKIMAERAGFEPAVHLWGHTHDFQSCSFSRSDISPFCLLLSFRSGVSRGEILTSHFNKIPQNDKSIFKKHYFWRREGDSNPRGSLWPPNRFRVDPVTTTSVPLRAFIKSPKRVRMLPSFP